MDRTIAKAGSFIVVISVLSFAICMLIPFDFGSYLVCMLLAIGYVMMAARLLDYSRGGLMFSYDLLGCG